MHIVFLGNCQVAALAGILRRFVGPYADYTSDFVDAYENVCESSYTRLAEADIVVAQSTSKPPALDHSHIPAGAHVHLVPLVSGAFLYPHRGVVHPLTPLPGYGNPPYEPEYNDRHLATLIGQGVTPQAALDRYRAADVAADSRAGRVYEMTMAAQRVLDESCGYDCASIIETWLTREQLFQSAFHFGNRIGRHIAATLCERLGFGAIYASRIAAHLDEPPFVVRFAPVHPSIARHFGMEWVREDTRYPFLLEGAYTFDEYVLRFMRAEWCPVLQEGILDGREGKPGARAKLEEGLRACPRSAAGYHELSRIVEEAESLEAALAFQEKAVACEPSSARLRRLAGLKRKAGDFAGAADALARWTSLDPFSPTAWTQRRNVLTKLGRDAEALHAAGQAVIFAPDTKAAQEDLARLVARQAGSKAKAPARRAPIRAILHVGPHKTGTTSIQLCLQALRQALRARGIAHPAVWEHAPDTPSHSGLARRLAEGAFAVVAEELRAIASPDIHTLVISSEMLSTLEEPALVGLRDCLAETLGGPVTVVFYLRRWSEIVPSLWQEQVKHGSAATLPEQIFRLLRDPERSAMLNWDRMLAPLAACFGMEAIRLVPYSVLRDRGEDIFTHFAASFLDWPGCLPPPLPPSNASRDVREIELVRALNAMAAANGEPSASTMRERLDRGHGLIETALLYKAMDRHPRSLRFNDALPPLAALHRRLFETYGEHLVQPRLPKRLFKPLAAELRYVAADYLAEPGAASALRALHEALTP